MSAKTLNQVGDQSKQIRAKLDRLDALRQFGAPTEGAESAKAAFDALENRTPPDLGSVKKSVPARGDWIQHVADLKIRETSMENLARFIASIERERPPWRLTGCTISATGNQPGIIRATLTIEALSKSMDM
jgi:hypothetical protein